MALAPPRMAEQPATNQNPRFRKNLLPRHRIKRDRGIEAGPDAAATAGVIQHVDDRPMNIGYENFHLSMPHGVHPANLFRFDPL